MQRLLDSTENRVVTLDVMEIFNDNNTKMEEINTEHISEHVLYEIFNENNEMTMENYIEFTPAQNVADEMSPQLDLKENLSVQKRFKSVDTNEVDEIAGKSCKKKNHKQTSWGVKVFQGNSN